MTDRERLLHQAVELAVQSASTAGGPFGALVVHEGRVIASGTNEVTLTNDPTAHAEVVAIRRACRALGTFRLAGCELYASCEPCPLCYAAALWARMAHVYCAGTRDDATAAGFDDSRVHAELALEPARRSLPVEVLLHEEARRPFDAWAANPHRVPY